MSKKSSASTVIPENTSDSAATPVLRWYEAIDQRNDSALKEAVKFEVKKILSKHKDNKYEVIYLYDDIDDISNYHADRIYQAASVHRDNDKDLLLVLHSRGGQIEPAYLISKTLKKISSRKFSVAIPRRAKSAATLISLGADEIHMGMMSELGPIDPQIGGLPAQSLSNALEFIAELSCRYPAASEILAKYLSDQIPLRVLGYYQRVNESAVQYAERLLSGKNLPQPAKEIAAHLVNHYKDHSFVIDFEEALQLLGGSIVYSDTIEYNIADEIFRFLDLVSMISSFSDREFMLVGSLDSGCSIRDKKKK